MTNYIVKGCPRIEAYTNNCWDSELPEEVPCKNRTDCKIKQLINAAMLEYKTPKEMEELQEKLNPFDYGTICAKHNMAHLIIMELGVQEVE